MTSLDIEKEAILNFEFFLRKSSILSSYITKNDKTPLVDGPLCVYKSGYKDKNEGLINIIEVQIKGHIVKNNINRCFYPINVADLKFYQKHPIIFVVCQILEETDEERLFYKSLLPLTIKHILQGKEQQQTINVPMIHMPDNVKEFEDIVLAFIKDAQKQGGQYAEQSIPISTISNGTQLQLSATFPDEGMTKQEKMVYLSTHPSFLYQKIIGENYCIELPLDIEPQKIIFTNRIDEPIKVGEQVFYSSYKWCLIDGYYINSVEDILQIGWSASNTSIINYTSLGLDIHSKSLDELLKISNFIIAISDAGQVSIGNRTIPIQTNKEKIDKLKELSSYWLAIKQLLVQLHVTKPLIWEQLTPEDNKWISLLIQSICYRQIVDIQHEMQPITLLNIGDFQLLLNFYNIADNQYRIFDFFDPRMSYMCTYNGSDLPCSAYSNLRDNKKWNIVDNINFDLQIRSYVSLKLTNPYIFMMALQDVESMMQAADDIETENHNRWEQLLKQIISVSSWLQDNDDVINQPFHIINRLQAINRQRRLNTDEISELNQLLQIPSLDHFVIISVASLLDIAQDTSTDGLLTKDMRWQIAQASQIIRINYAKNIMNKKLWQH